jgi:tape measure domain-containing protein
MAGVRIKVRADTSQARTEMNRLTTSVRGIETRVAGAARGLQKLLVFGAVTASVSRFSKSIIGATDALTKFENRVALVTGRNAKLNKSMNELYEIAGRSGSRISTVADTYGRIGLAVQDAGRSSQELLKVTEAINKSAQISGASAQTAAASIMQLSQGLGAGALRGEELNSVMEGIPDLARRIAAGMNIPFSELRELAKEGALDASSVFDAILSQSDEIDKSFSTLIFTVGDLTNVMGNEWQRMLAAIDSVVGISERLKKSIIGLTSAFKFVGDNIQSWVLNSKLQFLEFQLSAATTANNVILSLSSMFDFDLSGSRMISSIKGTIGVLKVFATDVIGVFKNIYMDVFGNSWWWDMWDEGKDYINSPRFSKALTDTLNTLKEWKNNTINIFKELFTESRNYLENFYSWERGAAIMASAASSMATSFEAIKDIALDAKSDPLGAFNELRLNLVEAIAVSLQRLKTAINQIEVPKGLLEIQSAVGTVLKSNIDIATEALELLKIQLDEFKEGVSIGFNFDTDKLQAGLIAAGLLISSYGWKTVLGGVAVFSVGLDLVQTEVFLERVRSTFRGVCKIIAGLFEEDGDILLNVVTALKGVVEAIYDGLLEGLFDGQQNFIQRASAVLATGISIAVSTAMVSSIVRKSLARAILPVIVSALSFAGTAIATAAAVPFAAIGAAIIGAIAASIAIENWDLDEIVGSWAGGVTTSFLDYFGISSDFATKAGDAVNAVIRVIFTPLKTIGKVIKAMFSADYSIADAIRDTISDVSAATDLLVNAIKSPFIEMFEWLSGKFNSVKDTIKNLVPSWLLSEDSSQTSASSSPDKFAAGGHVSGPGTSTSDSIPAMLSNGEYVIKARAAQSLGRNFLDRLNSGMSPVFRANGGPINDVAPIPSSASISGQSGPLGSTIQRLNAEIAGLRIQIKENSQVQTTNNEELSVINAGSTTAKGSKSKKRSKLSTYEEAARDFNRGFAQAIRNSLISGDIGEFFESVADTFTNKILDTFVNDFTESLLGDLDFSKMFEGIGALASKLGDGIFEGLSNMFLGENGLFSKLGGLFGEDGFGSIFSAIGGLFKADQGGTVPTTSYSQVGKDSVPALLKPGEMVIAPNRVNQFNDSHSKGGQTVVNLNITGDISKQTRKEVMGMIPQIAGGVNATNKERGYRA